MGEVDKLDITLKSIDQHLEKLVVAVQTGAGILAFLTFFFVIGLCTRA